MSPCTNKIPFKMDMTVYTVQFSWRVRKHRVITGQKPGINGIRRERNGKNRTNWHNAVIFCNTSITKRRAGHKGKGGIAHNAIVFCDMYLQCPISECTA